MKKWEYQKIELLPNEEIGPTIDREGILGWELVHINHGTFPEIILKREVPAKRGRPKKET